VILPSGFDSSAIAQLIHGDPVMQIFRYFLYVVAAALISSFLGGAFAGVISLISPEFVHDMFGSPDAPNPSTGAASKAIAVGAILGLFIGTAVICFGFGLMTAEKIARQFLKPLGNEDKPSDSN